VLTAIVFVLLPTACNAIVPHLEQPYSDPPATVSSEDLIGTWVAQYAHGTDQLEFRKDGTFRQCYQRVGELGCLFETPWTGVSLFPLSDGRVLVHLPGARYFLAGERIAALDGLDEVPCPLPNCTAIGPLRPFYDPVAAETVEVRAELLLNIRATNAGELVLLHMWTSLDRGFAIIGGQAEEFRRERTKDPLPNNSLEPTRDRRAKMEEGLADVATTRSGGRLAGEGAND